MSNQKILLVIDKLSNPHAGTEGQFLLLIDQLMSVDVDVDVHALVLSHSEWLANNNLKCPSSVLGQSSIKRFRTWIGIYKLARSFKARGFEVAHVFFNDASVVCPPMFKLAGLKTIISRRDMGFWYNKAYRFLLPLTGKFVDLVISNSQAVSEVTGQVEKIPAAKRVVIYNGFNRDVEHFVTIPELQLLKDRGAILVGLVANLRPIKRIQDLIAALALLPSNYQKLEVVIIGAGDPVELKALSSTLSVESRVHFLGSRADIPHCLPYFVAGALCSESEGFSNSIVEYQFAALPVICTRTGGNPEAVSHADTGWLYPVGDVDALAQSLRSLMDNPEEAHAMGRRALQLAQQKYSVEAMLKNHLEVYKRLTR